MINWRKPILSRFYTNDMNLFIIILTADEWVFL